MRLFCSVSQPSKIVVLNKYITEFLNKIINKSINQKVSDFENTGQTRDMVSLVQYTGIHELMISIYCKKAPSAL